MSQASHGLMIKYGLGSAPSDAKVREWVSLVIRYRDQGYSLEEAGRTAARQVFPDFGTHVYASEADTIEALLRAAGNK